MEGLKGLFTVLQVLFFAGLPLCFGLGVLLGWIIWG
jgi:hypothetical protein